MRNTRRRSSDARPKNNGRLCPTSRTWGLSLICRLTIGASIGINPKTTMFLSPFSHFSSFFLSYLYVSCFSPVDTHFKWKRACEPADEWTIASPVAPRTRSLLLLVSYWECSPAVAHGIHRNFRRSRKMTRRPHANANFSLCVSALSVYWRLHNSPNFAKRNDVRWNIVWTVSSIRERKREKMFFSLSRLRVPPLWHLDVFWILDIVNGTYLNIVRTFTHWGWLKGKPKCL